jgi:predicted GH43/DUF377 family glycosyl hydrolase
MQAETIDNTSIFTFDPTRIIPRFRKLADPDSLKIIASVMQLSESEVVGALNQLLRSFSIRYRNITRIFELHFQQLKPLMEATGMDHNILSYSRKSLLGAYFTYESAIETAALFNPCMVAAPDQSELQPGEQRVFLSFNALGEANQSSVVFRTGILDRFNQLHPEKSGVMPEAGIVRNGLIDKHYFLSQLFSLNGHIAKSEILGFFDRLEETFTLSRLKQFMGEEMEDNSPVKRLVDLNETLLSQAYEIEFSIDSDLSERVLLPGPDYNGIENISFTKFNGTSEDAPLYFGIYSTRAFGGHSYQLVATSDFCLFQVNPLSISRHDFTHLTIFPQKINDAYVILGSAPDGVYLAFSKNVNEWGGFTKILEPEHLWELANLAHLGAPLETDNGWLILTQATGPMGQRALGAVLVSLQNPQRIKARANKPVFQVQDINRAGMPGQGISSSGAILHNQMVVIPYTLSNHASGCVSFGTEGFITKLQKTALYENATP